MALESCGAGSAGAASLVTVSLTTLASIGAGVCAGFPPARFDPSAVSGVRPLGPVTAGPRFGSVSVFATNLLSDRVIRITRIAIILCCIAVFPAYYNIQNKALNSSQIS